MLLANDETLHFRVAFALDVFLVIAFSPDHYFPEDSFHFTCGSALVLSLAFCLLKSTFHVGMRRGGGGSEALFGR